MLLALPKVGRVKAAKIMNNCRVSPNKTFGGLSDRQRAELAERLNH
jgi:ribosomal protein S13